MKKVVALLLVMLLTLGALAGCSTPSGESSGASEASQGTQTESSGSEQSSMAGTKLVVMSSQNWVNDSETQIAAQFTEETGIEVDIQVVPDDQYLTILMSKLATGEGPDIFFARAGAGISDFHPDQYMLDLSGEEWVSRYEDWALRSVTYQDKVVGLNLWDVSGWAVMYNTQMFEEHGWELPTTYEGFKSLCAEIQAAGIRPIFHNSADTWHDMMWLNAMAGLAASTDPDIYDKLNNNEIKFADIPVLETALTQLKELVDLGYFGDTYLSDVWDDSKAAMGTENAAMILTYPAYQNEMVASYPELGAEDWSMFPIPLCDNTIWTHNAGGLFQAVNKDSKNLDAAKAYIAYLARADVVAQHYEGHPELGASTFADVAIAQPSCWDRLMENSPGGTATDFQTGIRYFDEVTVSKIIQEMYLGTKTPHEVLVAIDEYRQNMFDTEES